MAGAPRLGTPYTPRRSLRPGLIRPGPAIGFAVDLEFATQALERSVGRGHGGRRPKARRR